MSFAANFETLRSRFGDRVQEVRSDAGEPSVRLAPEDLLEVARFLRDETSLKFEMLNNISGVDYLEPDAKKAAKAGFEPHLEVVYHLCSLTHRARLTLKVVLPRWKDGVEGQLPEISSVSSIWKTADWHEREAYDLCGINFLNHPELTRILLSEDWEGHPLRKDYEFPLEYHGIRCR